MRDGRLSNTVTDVASSFNPGHWALRKRVWDMLSGESIETWLRGRKRRIPRRKRRMSITCCTAVWEPAGPISYMDIEEVQGVECLEESFICCCLSCHWRRKYGGGVTPRSRNVGLRLESGTIIT